MHILVLGGTGLFGQATVRYLLEDAEISQVVSLDVTPPKETFLKSVEKFAGKFHFVRGDVSQIEDILKVMKQYAVDRLINWAFILGDAVNTDPRLAVRVNALGMSNAFEAARIMGVSRVIFASSETVYGNQSDYGDRDVTEDDRLYPSHSYALCKRFAEIQADQYTGLYGMSFTGLRPTIGYGHGGRSPFIVKAFSDIVSLPAVGKPISFDIDGTALFSLVYAEELARFSRMLVKAPSSPHPVYNIGGPPQSLLDVAGAVRQYIPEARIAFGKEPMAGPGKGSLLPWKVSCARAREDFGFSLKPLEEVVLMHINAARQEAGLEPLSRR